MRQLKRTVRIGNLTIGGSNPIAVQTMLNVPVKDIAGNVEQAKRVAKAGCQIVRVTVPTPADAAVVAAIKEVVDIPVVADIHFDYKAALAAIDAGADKIRINPGNIGDDDRVKAVADACNAKNIPIRIGVNGGSLEKHILARYGAPVPEAMVESAMYHVRLLEKHDFNNIVISIKSSNVPRMMTAYRMLSAQTEYPLHVGVTEAGGNRMGLIKSGMGIGGLLLEGIGDTLRVSLSENPECEIPVAYHLAKYVTQRGGHPFIPGKAAPDFDYLRPSRRPTRAVGNIGGTNAPVVIGAQTRGDRAVGHTAPDYIYCGTALPPLNQRVPGAGYIVDAAAWQGEAHTYPAFPANLLMLVGACPAAVKFVFLSYLQLTEEVLACLRQHPEMVVIAQSSHANRLGEQRALVHELWREGVANPVVFFEHYALGADDADAFRLQAAADTGALLFDGLCDGLFLFAQTPQGSEPLSEAVCDDTAFGILQAVRARTTKTEYISCPGCGRTLYNLQGTLRRVKAATAHLTGLKIAVMGCIVNGPGEMADADYGYVGAARGRISLYRGKECVEMNIPEAEAVDKLLALIENDRKNF